MTQRRRIAIAQSQLQVVAGNALVYRQDLERQQVVLTQERLDLFVGPVGWYRRDLVESLLPSIQRAWRIERCD